MLAQLRPREQDVLRQVARGATAQQVETALGLNRSTVDKHLASVRRRLGVLRTAEAVVIFWQNHARRQRELDIPRETIADGGAPAAAFARFAAQLPEIADFDTARDSLCACLEHVGLASPVFDVLAEPFGHLTGGVKMLKWPLNRDLERQYERAGGQLRNPVSVAVATNRATPVISREALARLFSDHLPERQAGIVALQLIPEKYALAVNLPGQDAVTGAPFGITGLGRRGAVAQLHVDHRAQDRQLRALITLFWNHCKAQGAGGPDHRADRPGTRGAEAGGLRNERSGTGRAPGCLLPGGKRLCMGRARGWAHQPPRRRFTGRPCSARSERAPGCGP